MGNQTCLSLKPTKLEIMGSNRNLHLILLHRNGVKKPDPASLLLLSKEQLAKTGSA